MKTVISKSKKALISLAVITVSLAYNFNAQAQSQWLPNDRSKPTWSEIDGGTGYSDGTFSYYNTNGSTTPGQIHFFITGSVFQTGTTPQYVERIRFLVHTPYGVGDQNRDGIPDPADNFQALFPAGAAVGFALSTETAYDAFAAAKSVSPDIGKIIQLPVTPASVVGLNGQTVDLKESNPNKVRIVVNPANISGRTTIGTGIIPGSGGYWLEVEVLLPEADRFRIPSRKLLRVAPFLVKWGAQYDNTLMNVRRFSGSSASIDQITQFFSKNDPFMAPSLRGLSNCTLCAGNLDNPAAYRLAVGVKTAAIPFELSAVGANVYLNFSSARCMFIEKSVSGAPWVPVKQILASDVSPMLYVRPAGPCSGLECSAYFRLVEKDASDTPACLKTY